MRAFILAGGFATRLWPLTEKRAKPLLPLAGKPILSHIVEKIPADIPVTVSTNAAFARGFGEWKETMSRPNIDIVIEQTTGEDQKLGTNGAVAQWIRSGAVDDDVLLITGDNYLGFSLEKFIAAATPGQPLLAAYDIKDLAQAGKFGTVLVGPDGRAVRGFEEKPKEPKTTLVSTGCYLLPRATLPILAEYAKTHPDHIGGIFEEFLRRGLAVTCFTFAEPWFDIGSFDAYIDATKALVGENILVGRGVDMQGTVCEGSVVIGKNARIRASKLRDTVLFDDCVVDDCVLERCVLDNGCNLRGIDVTGKMLREKTTLKRG